VADRPRTELTSASRFQSLDFSKRLPARCVARQGEAPAIIADPLRAKTEQLRGRRGAQARVREPLLWLELDQINRDDFVRR
jgi:hypothetical protein